MTSNPQLELELEAGKPPQSFKTLVRFANVTYRIGRLRYGEYEVVRIIDDEQIGVFTTLPDLRVTRTSIHAAFVLKIALAAAEGARPSWIERLALAWRR